MSHSHHECASTHLTNYTGSEFILLIRSTVCVSSGRPDDGYCTIGGADIHGMALKPRDEKDGGSLVSNSRAHVWEIHRLTGRFD